MIAGQVAGKIQLSGREFWHLYPMTLEIHVELTKFAPGEFAIICDKLSRAQLSCGLID